MKYMLDTNICIYCIRKNPSKVFHRIQEKQGVGDIGISAITYSELQFGVANSSNPEQNHAALAEFVAPMEVFDYKADIAEIYGSIRVFLKRKGRLVGPLDLLIAAHALYLQSTLVTNNVREFARIPQLQIENWTQ